MAMEPFYQKRQYRNGLNLNEYWGDAPPSASTDQGPYQVGDIVINTAPGPGTAPFWVCTTGGATGAVAVFQAPTFNFATVVPGTETAGSVITTGTTWLVHSAVGSCAAKLLCSYSAASGDFATLRIRARSDAAGAVGGDGQFNGVVGGNFSASANINNQANLFGVQGYAQPNTYTHNNAAHVACGVYSCVDATAASSGRRWSMWTDEHSTTKAAAGHYLHRLSHNGTVAIDGLWTVYGGGRLPLMLNVEDATPGFVGTSGTAASNFGARLAISINGTPMWLNAYTTSNA